MHILINILCIYVLFLTWGVLQERLSTTTYNSEKYTFFVFLNLIQALTSVLVSYMYLIYNKVSLKLNNTVWLSVLIASISQTLASPIGYLSLKHINYPTFILGKSCKLVPVLLTNVLLFRQKFPLYKYTTVMLVSVGVSCFALFQPVNSNKVKSTENSLLGLFLLFVNLLMDGLTNSTQDSIFRKHRINGQQMMLMMNLVGSCLLFVYLLAPFNNELYSATDFCLRNVGAIKDVLLFSLCGALGQCFIFELLSKHGSLILVTTTVTRKLFTIVLSVLWFNHKINIKQWVSIALVFSGIVLEAMVKIRNSQHQQPLKKKAD